MSKILSSILFIITLGFAACSTKEEAPKKGNSELDFLYNELRLLSIKEYAMHPPRHTSFYKAISQMDEIGRQIESSGNLSSESFHALKESYLKSFTDLYSHLSDSEVLYKDTVNNMVENLNLETGKIRVLELLRFTSTLALLDLQNHLMAKTIYIDDIRFYTKQTVKNDSPYVQVFPMVVNDFNYARFIVGTDTIFSPMDSLMIRLEDFKKYRAIKIDFLTRTSKFEKAGSLD